VQHPPAERGKPGQVLKWCELTRPRCAPDWRVGAVVHLPSWNKIWTGAHARMANCGPACPATSLIPASRRLRLRRPRDDGLVGRRHRHGVLQRASLQSAVDVFGRHQQDCIAFSLETPCHIPAV